MLVTDQNDVMFNHSVLFNQDELRGLLEEVDKLTTGVSKVNIYFPLRRTGFMVVLIKIV